MGWVLLIVAAAFVVPRIMAGKGSSGPGQGELPPCTAERFDGPYRICLTHYASTGKWGWRAELIATGGLPDAPREVSLPSEYESEADALVGAWQELSAIPIGSRVIKDASLVRHGVQLVQSGAMTLLNQGAYVNAVSPVISTGQMAGQDAAGAVMDVIAFLFGENVNPLRLTINGQLLNAAVDRVAKVNPPNPPTMARAIFIA